MGGQSWDKITFVEISAQGDKISIGGRHDVQK